VFTPFDDATAEPAIHGFLHSPPEGKNNGHAIALTHGAGATCQSRLLVALSDALAACGFIVLRFDLPFRQARPFGPPRPGSAERDREGLRRAAMLLRPKAPGHLSLGGHSYGGRQASMLLAEAPEVADGLLLLSYPLHPPKKPADLRTQHFPRLTKPTFFVHGTRDPFATVLELRAALRLIPAPHALLEINSAAHDLLPRQSAAEVPVRIAQAFLDFVSTASDT